MLKVSREIRISSDATSTVVRMAAQTPRATDMTVIDRPMPLTCGQEYRMDVFGGL